MAEQETVVLVHGLWMRGAVMALMRRRVGRCGYRTVSYSYPSMRLTLTENADRLARFCSGLGATTLHLVGHSLGGLVILRMLECSPETKPGRIVLLGSSVGGSHSARRLARLPGGRAALGRSIPESLERARSQRVTACEAGVIAGDVSIGFARLLAPDLPRPNDGVVTVAETDLPGMRERVILHVNHFGMLLSAEVVRQICEFLRNGAFIRRAV